MYERGRSLAAWLPGHHLAFGGGGLAHLIVRLFIWHEIWRLLRYLWRIHTFGPIIVIGLVIVIVGLGVWRQTRGRGRPDRGRGGGPASYGGGDGPRDW
jgi:hypothetical protein